MGLIINDTDFTGITALPESSQQVIADYITEHEKKYLYSIFGAELAALIIADLNNGVPQTAKYLALFNEFAEDYFDWFIYSRGLKDALVKCVWFEFMRDTYFKPTQTGISKTSGDTATITRGNLYGIYNDAIESILAIQTKIMQSPGDYPEFNGQEFDFENQFI